MVSLLQPQGTNNSLQIFITDECNFKNLQSTYLLN